MKKIRIVFVDKDFSRFATFPLIGSFLIDFLKLNERFQVLSTKRRKIVFSKIDYCLTLISCIFLGIKNLNNIDDCLQTEGKLAELTGIEAKTFPKRAPCYKFLCSCTHWNVKQVDRINFDLLKEHSLLHRKKRLIVDIIKPPRVQKALRSKGLSPGLIPNARAGPP